jgi:hypothetical protein
LAIVFLFAGGVSTAGAAPANDNFPGATIDATPFGENVDTTDATLEEDEPEPSCYGIVSSVWFTFTSQETAVYLLDVKPEGNFLPLVVLYEESSFPGGGLVEEACASYPSDEGEGPHIALAFQADAAEEYFIQIGGFDLSFGGPLPEPDPTGTAAISLTKAEPPVNDDFADALVLDDHPSFRSVELTGATVEADEPMSTCFDDPYFGGGVGNTAWYKHTATRSSAIFVEPLEGFFSFFYPTIVVWTGTLGDLTEVACGSLTGFETTAGETYYIQVGQLQYDGGYFLPGEAIASFSVEYHDMPECSGAEWSFTDPAHDIIDENPFPPDDDLVSPDVVEVRASSNAEWACLTVKFADPIEPNTTDVEKVIGVELVIDTDQSKYSGDLLDPNDPCRNDELGFEFFAYANNSRNLAAPVYKVNLGDVPEFGYGFQFSTNDSITIALELENIGDANFNVALRTYGADAWEVDCVLNHEYVPVSPSTKSRFGDVDCDGFVTLLDSAEVLQGAAGVEVTHHPGCAPVGTMLPSEYAVPASGSSLLAGDIDCDTLVTPLDALALLREIAQVPGQRPGGCPVVGDAPLG